VSGDLPILPFDLPRGGVGDAEACGDVAAGQPDDQGRAQFVGSAVISHNVPWNRGSGGGGNGEAIPAAATLRRRATDVSRRVRYRGRPGVDGNTAIELMVTLGVLGILTLVLVPVIGNFSNVMEARGAVEQVTSALRLGRQNAIARSLTCAVTLTATTVANCLEPAPQSIAHDATLDPGSCGLPCTVAFDSLGATTPPVVAVRVSRPGATDQSVCVAATGRIYAKPPGATCP
jgi:type II secretory pathway pseudopilin PulG